MEFRCWNLYIDNISLFSWQKMAAEQAILCGIVRTIEYKQAAGGLFEGLIGFRHLYLLSSSARKKHMWICFSICRVIQSMYTYICTKRIRKTNSLDCGYVSSCCQVWTFISFSSILGWVEIFSDHNPNRSNWGKKKNEENQAAYPSLAFFTVSSNI